MRCEGWRRHGGAFTLGPVKWVQCDNEASVMLKVKQEKMEYLPSCIECWNEAKERGIQILSADPLTPNAGNHGPA
jgi:hypothetical protein